MNGKTYKKSHKRGTFCSQKPYKRAITDQNSLVRMSKPGIIELSEPLTITCFHTQIILENFLMILLCLTHRSSIKRCNRSHINVDKILKVTYSYENSFENLYKILISPIYLINLETYIQGKHFLLRKLNKATI